MQLPPWKRPDNFGLTAHQPVVDELNRVSHLTPTGPAEVLGSPHGTTVSVGRAPTPPPPVFRMRVKTPDVAPDTVLAVRYNGTTEATEQYAVRVYWQREVDEEIYAYRPVVYNGAPVDWLEIYTLGSPQYQHQHVTAVAQGQVGWDFHRAHAMPGEV